MTKANPTLSELNLAKQILDSEAKSIQLAKDRLGPEFVAALDLITDRLKKGGKVVVTGVGKSGKVADKVAATMSSTGSLAVYLHPGEAAHGDLGMVSPHKDVLLAFSNSGNSDEILKIIPTIKHLGIPIIAVLGQEKSSIANHADVLICYNLTEEACPFNLAPTSSTTVSIAIGDALALCLSKRWNFREEQFAILHPAGALGRRLTLLVRDLMKKNGELGWVSEDANIEEIVATATEKKLGAVLVGSPSHFLGMITDGDIRRSLKHKEKFFTLRAKDIMTKNPVATEPDKKAQEALQLMENRPSQISVLPVIETIDKKTHCVGVVRLHDLIGQF